MASQQHIQSIERLSARRMASVNSGAPIPFPGGRHNHGFFPQNLTAQTLTPKAPIKSFANVIFWQNVILLDFVIFLLDEIIFGNNGLGEISQNNAKLQGSVCRRVPARIYTNPHAHAHVWRGLLFCYIVRNRYFINRYKGLAHNKKITVKVFALYLLIRVVW